MTSRPPLALKYRPRRFSDLAGQVPSAAVLYQMARRGTVPPVLLLAGQHGCGKTSAARILGAALNCAAGPGPAAEWPCGTCPSCTAVADGTSLAVLEVDAASNGGVENIRAIREQVLYGTAGEHHVVLLDEAHSMSREAFNALLKTFEEPPPLTVFVLLTTEPGRVPATIASRAMTFTFRRIPVPLIRQRLDHIAAAEQITAEPALLSAIAQRAGGAMRDAVMLLDQADSAGITTAQRWQQLLGEPDFAPALLAAAADGDCPRAFAELDAALDCADPGWVTGQLASCLRDVLVLASGGDVTTVTGTALDARAALAARVSPARAVAALRVVWDLQTRVRPGETVPGLSVAVALLCDALAVPGPAPGPGPGTAAPVSGLAELRALVARS